MQGNFEQLLATTNAIRISRVQSFRAVALEEVLGNFSEMYFVWNIVCKHTIIMSCNGKVVEYIPEISMEGRKIVLSKLSGSQSGQKNTYYTNYKRL